MSVIFTYCQNGGETDGVEFETDGVEFDTYWQNGGYKKISDIIFAECHIFIVSNLWYKYTFCKIKNVRYFAVVRLILL